MLMASAVTLGDLTGATLNRVADGNHLGVGLALEAGDMIHLGYRAHADDANAVG